MGMMTTTFTTLLAQAGELLSMVLVGALWGCTNPWLRKGSVEAVANVIGDDKNPASQSSFLRSFLRTFLNFKVWLPYVLNQSGSLVFYVLLRNTNLSMAVPTCNALALVFSFATSLYLGERIHKPFQTLLGASLIFVGVAICVASSANDKEEGDAPPLPTTTMEPEL